MAPLLVAAERLLAPLNQVLAIQHAIVLRKIAEVTGRYGFSMALAALVTRRMIRSLYDSTRDKS